MARALRVENLYADRRRFDVLLESLWVIGSEDAMAVIFGGEDNSVRAGINQHIHGNSGAWSVEEFFDQLGALDSIDRRFALFLEGLASADMRPMRRYAGRPVEFFFNGKQLNVFMLTK